MPTHRIILPLDHVPWHQALPIVKAAKGLVWGYKIRRSILENGLSVLDRIKEFGNAMLDFKLFDIPSAMTESLRLHLDAGADITTVHCTSGYDPSAWSVRKEPIAGVTILTSMSQTEFKRYYAGPNIMEMAVQMANDAEGRYGYLVCSPVELERIQHCRIRKICPGIRPVWYQNDDDQQRTATPAEAVRHGADLLVIGRPILTSADIRDALIRTNAEIESADQP